MVRVSKFWDKNGERVFKNKKGGNVCSIKLKRTFRFFLRFKDENEK